VDLSDYRKEIDRIDDEMTRLFARRMDVAAKIGEYKLQNGLPTHDPGREREKLSDVASKSPDDVKAYATVLYSLIFELSRAYQERICKNASPLQRKISAALENTPKLFPEFPVTACQGVEGAYSALACEKLFRVPNILYFRTFEDVFNAIESGLCEYGVLPIENSTAGSVNQVYDLMMRHDFSIVRSVRLKVDHNLLARPGAKMEGLTEIISHQQAIAQCGAFLKRFPGVKVTACENTAEAAKIVSESGRDDIAALSSRHCAETYGLSVLSPSVQDTHNNFTRFICISKNLEIYPGASRTSLMMVLPHKPGSLYKVLSRFYALHINLTKLESRPMPDRNFEFMFYFDVDTQVYSESFVRMMCELDSYCEEFKYLGSYLEMA